MTGIPRPLDTTTPERRPDGVAVPIDSLLPVEEVQRPANLDGVAITDPQEVEPLETTTRIRAEHDAALAQLSQDLLEDPESDRINEVPYLERTTELQVPRSGEDLSQYYIEDAVAYQNPAYLSQSITLMRNRQIFMEELQRFRDRVDDTGTVRSVLNWLDYNIARAAVNAVEGITDRTSRQGSEFYGAMLDADADSVRRFVREKVDAAMSEGILFEGGGTALAQLEREMFSYGENPDLIVDRLLGAFDIATFGSTAIAVRAGRRGVRSLIRAAKGPASRSSTIGSLRGSTTLSRATDGEINAAAGNFGFTPATRAGAAGGREAANKTAFNVLARTDDPDTLGDVGSSWQRPNTGSLVPTHSIFREAADVDSIQRAINELEQRRGLQTTETKANAQRIAADLVEEFKNIYGKRILTTSKPLGIFSDEAGTLLEGYRIETFLGKADGTSFNSREAAQRLADQVGGTVVPDGTKQFSVKLEQRINTTGATGGEISQMRDVKSTHALARAFDNVMSNLFKITGMQSRRYGDVQELDDLALRAQSAEKKLFSELQRRVDTVVSKLTPNQQAALDDVLTELTNTAGDIKRSWDRLEFDRLYKNKTGELPDKNVQEAFRAYHDVSDATYLMQARLTLQRVLRSGFTQSVRVTDSFKSAAKKVTANSVKDDDLIYNARDGKFIRKADLDGMAELAIFRLNDTFSEGASSAKFVVMPREVSALKASDVLGYAAYGRRTNPQMTNFLTLVDELGNLKTLLGSRTTKQALKAKEEFEALQKALKDTTLSKTQLNKIIRANNSWNPDIEDIDGLRKFFKENGIDPQLRGNFVAKARNARITTAEGAPPMFGDEATIADVVNHNMSRSKYVLTEYGGGKAYNPSAVESIVTQYANTSKAWAYNFYTYRAAQGWMETATRLAKEGKIQIDNVDGIPANDWLRRFENAEIRGSGDFAAQFREAQNIFNARRGQKTIVDQKLGIAWDRALEKINDSEFLGQFGIKVDPNFLKGVDKDLLGTGFFAAFWGNLSQAYLQSTGMLFSLTLAREGVGLKGAGSQLLMRKIMAAAKDSKQERMLLQRLADRLDITLQDAEEMAVLWRDMQPHIVLNDIMEIGTGLGADTLSEGISGIMGKVRRSSTGRAADRAYQTAREFGLKPFNWGEINTKSTAFQIALLEYKAINPKASLLDDAARNYVARRTETLSTNMTSQSRSNIQKGIGAIPTQWMGFTMRLTEQVFAGRDLTVAERGKLFFVAGPMVGGLSGIPFMSGLADDIAVQIGLDPNNEDHKAYYAGIKYGVMDAAIAYFTPVETAIGQRIAPFNLYEDLYERIFVERDFAAILGGPSGSIAYTGYEAVANFVGSISQGHNSSFTEDSMRILRNFSGVNNIAGAWGIINEGVYRNRKGLSLPIDLDPLDAVTIAFGFSPLERQEFYNLRTTAFRESREYSRYASEIREESARAWSIMADDPMRGMGILREAETLIDNYNASEESKRSLRRLLQMRSDTRVTDALETIRRRDSSATANFIQEIIN